MSGPEMLDFFRDSPAYEWMTRDARKEVREEMSQEVQKALQETQRALNASRQTVVTLVAERFPKLARLAKKQVEMIENPEVL